MQQFGNEDSDISGDSESVDKQRHTHKNWLSMQYTMEAHKDIMSPSQYREHLRNLNSGQRQIVMYNRAWCKAAVITHKKGKSINSYRIFLSGPGGTGKSHVINLIRRDVKYFSQLTGKVEPDDPLVLLTAPTGSVAFQIAGLTIHAALQLNSNSVSMSYENKTVLFQKLKLMVTNEISMVGNERFCDMGLRLCKILHGDIWKNDFGGISMLVFGDLYQLPPVMQCPIPIYQQTVIKEPDDMTLLLWHTFILHELKQIMHQKDPEFSKMLNVVCVKQPEENSIEDIMLRSCELSIDALHSEYPKSAMHVFATNADAALWNNKMLENIEGEIYSYIADDSRKD